MAEVEVLGDEVRQRVAHLRAVLPPELFRHVWAQLEAQQRQGLAERLLAERPGQHSADVRSAPTDVR